MSPVVVDVVELWSNLTIEGLIAVYLVQAFNFNRRLRDCHIALIKEKSSGLLISLADQLRFPLRGLLGSCLLLQTCSLWHLDVRRHLVFISAHLRIVVYSLGLQSIQHLGISFDGLRLCSFEILVLRHDLSLPLGVRSVRLKIDSGINLSVALI